MGRRAAWLCPRPRYQRGEAADRAGGASLGRRRPRLVLDTGLSGLELPHKGPGRRRNKGLFHAATEKPQISTGRAARAGGAGGHPPGSPPAARGPPWSGASGEPQSGQADPSLLLRMPPGSPGHVNRLHSALCGFGGLPLPLPSSGRVCPLCRPLNNCHSYWSHRPSHLCSPCRRATPSLSQAQFQVASYGKIRIKHPVCWALCLFPALTAACKLVAALPSFGN